jgi:two-component system, cell cycle response regulator DivK
MSQSTPASGPSHARWVLVIEDLRDQAELCLDICAQAGLNTTAAATGAQGYKKACNTRPDVILLDLMLPDMDGWDVCRQLRNDPQTSDIPIVVLTARDEAHGARRAREAGCAAYLKKPCPPADLVATIQNVLNEKKRA